MKLGVQAFPPSAFRDMPTSVRMVLVDVAEHPGGTIGQIVERLGFPQSHVSAAVARLRDDGMLVTNVDPADRRRTLVSLSPEHLANVERAQHTLPPVDDLLVAALVERLGAEGADHVGEATAALDLLASLFTAPQPCAPAAAQAAEEARC
jgi:DNA-binding MarR family transcriptional regulator